MYGSNTWTDIKTHHRQLPESSQVQLTVYYSYEPTLFIAAVAYTLTLQSPYCTYSLRPHLAHDTTAFYDLISIPHHSCPVDGIKL